MNVSWNRLRAVLVAGTIAALPSVSSAEPQGTPATTAVAAGQDLRALAARLVGEVARVKKGDVVTVRGDVRDFDLMDELGLAVHKAGGVPLLLPTRERTRRRYFEDVPADHDAAVAALEARIAGLETVVFEIEGEEHPEFHRSVPPARLAAIRAAGFKLFEQRQKRNVRIVVLGNGLYPTAATAKRFGLPVDQLARLFWDGVNTDVTRLKATADAVRALLVGSKEVHVMTAAGTDMRFKIAPRTVAVSDGVISDDDLKKKKAALIVWLPAGEVYVTLVSGTAEGKIVIPRFHHDGDVIEDLRLTFKKGKVVEVSAKQSIVFDRWKAVYDAAPRGKDELSVFDVGINPSVKATPGSELLSYVAAGTVMMSLGNNTWAGGTNRSSFSMHPLFNDATVTVDGAALVEGGVLKVQGSTASK